MSEAGYTLRPAATSLPAGQAVPFAFQVTGPDGAPVTSYAEKHEKELHLVVVRRDLATFRTSTRCARPTARGASR